MKPFFVYCLLAGLLTSASSCKKDQNAGSPYGGCASQSQTVKTVTDLEGTVGFDAALQQYVISRAQPGTYDSVDIGVVCGTLPASLQVAGTKVIFSGAYQEYSNPPKPPVSGPVYYYLELAKVAAK